MGGTLRVASAMPAERGRGWSYVSRLARATLYVAILGGTLGFLTVMSIEFLTVGWPWYLQAALMFVSPPLVGFAWGRFTGHTWRRINEPREHERIEP